MFADIAGYTAMMQKDENGAKLLRDKYRAVLESCLNDHGGEIIQYYGDGALCIFKSPKEAVLGSGEMQSAFLAKPEVPVRIGIHIGDIVRDEAGIYGDGVNIASRIESLAVPGSVLLSQKVQLELENHPDIRTSSLGAFDLKNVRRPVEVYALDRGDITVPHKDTMTSSVAERPSRSIAVLPFKVSGDDEEGEYFADGVSEEITSGLNHVEGLSVISRTTCIAIAKSSSDSVEIGRRHNVSHLLGGSVRKAGNRVRMSVQLVQTADGYQVWAKTFDGTLDNIFDLQDNIAKNVISALRVNFDLMTRGAPVVQEQTQNSEAYNLYLKGLHHWKKHNPENVQKAREIFDHALSLDPGFSSAQCALSHCYAFLGSCGVIPTVDAYARAIQHAMTAIESNPQNAEAHLAIANIRFHHQWDWAGTKHSLDKAIALGLNSGMLHQTHGLYFAAMGEHEQGVRVMQRALELDPMSIPAMNMLATLHLFNTGYDAAIRIYEEILDLEPNFRTAHEFKGVALLCKGLYREALDAFTIYHSMVSNPKRGLMGHILSYHALGYNDKRDELIEVVRERYAHEPSASVEIDLALVYTGTGHYDEAVDYMTSVYEKRFSIACMGMIWLVRCPYFKELWQNPGFGQLMGRMGLPLLAA